ncbi:MAG TPA: hypothetical protein VMX16_08650 [Terriglobia bacterium]|nr:hypothetical protein [Terriglobia bacterium]
MEAKTVQIPFRDPQLKPTWAALSRLGGDQVSILFEELRSRLSKIEGIVESREYEPSEGWLASYRTAAGKLCQVQILPGVLTGIIDFSVAQLKSVSEWPRCSNFIKGIIGPFRDHRSTLRIKFPLQQKPQVASFAVLVIWLNRVEKGGRHN